MRYLKHLFKNTCLLLLIISSVSLAAQDYKGTLNQDLPESFVQQKKQEAQSVSLEIYTALIAKDINSLMLYIPEKSVYLEMAEQYNYRDDAEKQRALGRIEAKYDQHRENMRSQFVATSQLLKSQGNLSQNGFDMGFSPKRPFPGGKAGLNLKDQEGVPYQLFLDGLYFFNNRWYVLKAVSLRS